MRDLFQVVFELKKKEIEIARQQIGSSHRSAPTMDHQSTSLSIRNTATHESASSPYAKSISAEPSNMKHYAAKEVCISFILNLKITF